MTRLVMGLAALLALGCSSGDSGSSSQGAEGAQGGEGGQAGSGGSGGSGEGGSQAGSSAEGGSTTGGSGATGGSGTGATGQGGSGGTSVGATGGVGQGGSSVGGSGGQKTGALCFADLADGPIELPDYDALGANFGNHCFGTDHQDIEGVERLVILGDSISHGTFPTPADQFWANQFNNYMQNRFPGVEFQNCAKDGAETDDLDGQIDACFPGGVEQKKTLIAFTMGGNDIKSFAGDPLPQAMAGVDQSIANLDAALGRLTDPSMFPNGSYVIFANVYEYTDMSGNLSSCLLANLIGLSGNWIEGAEALMHMHEGYMSAAIKYGVDMVFMQEHFCGHGYAAGDASLQCYRGPGAANWFDASCIHPTPEGHTQITGLFKSVVEQ